MTCSLAVAQNNSKDGSVFLCKHTPGVEQWKQAVRLDTCIR